MPFGGKNSVQTIPTHFQYMKEHPDDIGIETDIVKVFQNEKWRTLTLVGTEFKLNLKYETVEEYVEQLFALQAELKSGGKAIAYLRDCSNPGSREYNCDYLVESTKSAKGRKVTWDRGTCEIE